MPFAFSIFIAPRSPKLVERFGANKVVATGLTLICLGQFLLSRLGIDTAYLSLLPRMLLMSSGMALVVSPMTTSIMSSVPCHKAGVGSAMNDTTRELGGALGVAVLGSIVASRYSSRIDPLLGSFPPSARAAAGRSVSAAVAAARSLGESQGAALTAAARKGYVSGMSLAKMIASSIALLAAVIVYRLLPAQTMPSAIAPDPK